MADRRSDLSVTVYFVNSETTVVRPQLVYRRNIKIKMLSEINN